VRGGGSASVLILADLPLLPRAAEPRNSAAPRLLVQLAGAQCGEERQAIITSAARGLGFERLGYGRVRIIGKEIVHTSMCVPDDDRNWAQVYRERGYEAVDPRVRLTSGSTLPFHWSVANLRKSVNSTWCEATHACLDALENTGLRSGIVFIMPGPQPGERSLIGLSSSADESQINNEGVMADALMLSFCLHEFCSHYLQWPSDAEHAPTGLSAAQLQVLQGLGRGLSNRELAAELNLSEHGVDYHLRQLRRHFNARNRVELVQASLLREVSQGRGERPVPPEHWITR
jgi:DNA-binding CsgD family transcriptional regulator